MPRGTSREIVREAGENDRRSEDGLLDLVRANQIVQWCSTHGGGPAMYIVYIYLFSAHARIPRTLLPPVFVRYPVSPCFGLLL